MPALSHRFPHHPRALRPARGMRRMHTRVWSVLPRSAGTFKPENSLVSWEGRWWWTGGIWECLVGFRSVIVLRSFYVVHPDFELRILLPRHLKCWLWCLWIFAVVCLFVCLFPTTNKTAVKQPSKGQSGGLRQLPSRYCQTGLPYTERSRGWFADVPCFLLLLLLCHTYRTTACLKPAPLFSRSLRMQQRAAVVWKRSFLRALAIKLTAIGIFGKD